MTLNSRMSVAGDRTADVVEVQLTRRYFGSADTPRDRPRSSERRDELRRQLIDQRLPEIAARQLQQTDDSGVHHRFQRSDGLLVEAALEQLRRDPRDTVARQHAANDEHRSEQSRDQQCDGPEQEPEDDNAMAARHGASRLRLSCARVPTTERRCEQYTIRRITRRVAITALWRRWL